MNYKDFFNSLEPGDAISPSQLGTTQKLQLCELIKQSPLKRTWIKALCFIIMSDFRFENGISTHRIPMKDISKHMSRSYRATRRIIGRLKGQNLINVERSNRDKRSNKFNRYSIIWQKSYFQLTSIILPRKHESLQWGTIQNDLYFPKTTPTFSKNDPSLITYYYIPAHLSGVRFCALDSSARDDSSPGLVVDKNLEHPGTSLRSVQNKNNIEHLDYLPRSARQIILTNNLDTHPKYILDQTKTLLSAPSANNSVSSCRKPDDCVDWDDPLAINLKESSTMGPASSVFNDSVFWYGALQLQQKRSLRASQTPSRTCLIGNYSQNRKLETYNQLHERALISAATSTEEIQNMKQCLSASAAEKARIANQKANRRSSQQAVKDDIRINTPLSGASKEIFQYWNWLSRKNGFLRAHKEKTAIADSFNSFVKRIMKATCIPYRDSPILHDQQIFGHSIARAYSVKEIKSAILNLNKAAELGDDRAKGHIKSLTISDFFMKIPFAGRKNAKKITDPEVHAKLYCKFLYYLHNNPEPTVPEVVMDFGAADPVEYILMMLKRPNDTFFDYGDATMQEKITVGRFINALESKIPYQEVDCPGKPGEKYKLYSYNVVNDIREWLIHSLRAAYKRVSIDDLKKPNFLNRVVPKYLERYNYIDEYDFNNWTSTSAKTHQA